MSLQLRSLEIQSCISLTILSLPPITAATCLVVSFKLVPASMRTDLALLMQAGCTSVGWRLFWLRATFEPTFKSSRALAVNQ